MLSQPIIFQMDSEEHQEDSPMMQYNKNIINNYLRQSKVTCCCILLIFVIFIVEVLLSWTSSTEKGYGIRNVSPQILIKMGGNVPILVKSGQIYRLVTACFLHAGALHLLFNTVSLFSFCASVESMFGTKMYLAVYLIGGIQGNMLFDLKNVITNTHATVAIGASTSICAIMGLFISNVLILHFKGIDVKELRKRIVFMLVTLLMISLIPGVDFFGHLGSLISGFCLGLVLIAWRDTEVVKARNAGIALLSIYTLILMLVWFL